MKTKCKSSTRASATGGFTLVEAMIASGVMFLYVMVCMTALLFDQVAVRRSKEEALVMDFMNHYVENIKAMPFNTIATGYPINGLNPNIVIPATGSTISISNTDYQTFDPDLLWIAARNPLLGFTMDKNYSNGVLHDIHMSITVNWAAPLQKGGNMSMETDVIRTQDQ